MHRSASFFFAFLVLVMSGNPALADLTWQRFTDSDGRFSVKMPGKPTYSESQTHDVTRHTYTYKSDMLTLSAEYEDLPGLAVVFGGQKTIYSKVLESFLKKTEGTEVSRLKNEIDAYDGEIVSYRTPTREGKLMLILIGRRLYVLQASIHKDEKDKSALNTFIGSFTPSYRDKNKGHHSQR